MTSIKNLYRAQVLADYADVIRKAANMVEIELTLSQITADYLLRYAVEVEKVPAAGPDQRAWISKARNYFEAEIRTDKRLLFTAIPGRFERTEIYKRLKNTI